MTATARSRERLASSDHLAVVLDELEVRWAEPHRRYHAPSHLEAALAALDRFDLDDGSRLVVEWAVWFHDAIYDATAADNEQRSADLAHRRLRGHLPDGDVDEVVRLVLLTAGHLVEPGDALGAVMIDVDLSILGADAERYRAYTVEVRQEYAHRSDGDWRTGRGRFVSGMLARGHLFHTEEGRRRWEAAARRNLAAERDLLSG